MPADVLIPLPDGVSDRTASTLMMKGMTAQYLFRQVYPLKGGETILYHAAAGGVGLVACQWARALGVTMIGTVSTDEKAEIARAHGCAHTIVTSREDIAKRVREITDGKGVPVVYDSVGKDTLMASLDSLQPRGTLVSNGTSSGPVVIDTHAARGQGLDLGHAAGDGPLRHAALAHAGDGRRAVRPRAGRPHRRRAEAELRARRCGRGAPRARVAPDHRRDRAGALKRAAPMDLPRPRASAPAPTSYLFGRGPAWFAFAMTMALMIVDYVDRQVIVSLFPYMKADWGLSDKQLGALVSVVSVTVALGALPVALFADRASRVKSIVVMATVWSLATISCMFTRSYGQLLAARAVVGLGEAGYGSVGAALIASHFPARMRGALLAAFFASASVGSVLGVMLGGVIAARWGWQAAFGVVGVPGPGAGAAVPEGARLPHRRARRRRSTRATRSTRQRGAAHRAGCWSRSRTMLWVCIGGAAQLIVVSAAVVVAAELPQPRPRHRARRRRRSRRRWWCWPARSAAWSGARWSTAPARAARARKLLTMALLCIVAMLVLVLRLRRRALGHRARGRQAQFALIVLGGFLMTCTVGPVSAIVIDVIHPGVRATGASVLALFQNLFGLAAGPFIAGVLSDAWGLATGAGRDAGLRRWSPRWPSCSRARSYEADTGARRRDRPAPPPAPATPALA